MQDERQYVFLRAVQLEAQLKTSKGNRDACAAAVIASPEERRSLFQRTEELRGDVESTEKWIAVMVSQLQIADQEQQNNGAASEEFARLS